MIMNAKQLFLLSGTFLENMLKYSLCSITYMICEYKLQRREKLKGILTSIPKTVLDVKSIQLTVPVFPIIAF